MFLWFDAFNHLLTKPDSTQSITFFNSNYFYNNFIRYLAGVMGGPLTIAGLEKSIIPVFVGTAALFGLVLNLSLAFFTSSLKFISLSLLLLSAGLILYISFFYAHDGRYIIPTIPLLILSLGISLSFIKTYFIYKRAEHIFHIILVGFFIYYIFLTIPQIKDELTSRFSGQQKPINYLFVKTLNDYFKKVPEDKKPLVISGLPPYFIDFYSNGNYDLLPFTKVIYLDSSPDTMTHAWGPEDYSDIISLYKRKLSTGYPIYITNFQLDQYYYFKREFKELNEKFKIVKVFDGCNGDCKIYNLSLK